MILKSSLLLLVLTVSQAFATSIHVPQLRGLEILESRQDKCPICTTVSETLGTCGASGSPAVVVRCSCSSTVSSQVQACVNCGAGNTADSTIQTLIDSYSQLCTSSPTITKPGGSGATGVPAKVSSGISDKGKRAVAAIGAIVGAALVI